MSLFYDLKKSGEWGEFNDEERNAITGEMKDIVGILQTREEVPAPPPPPEDLTGGPITMVSRTEMQPADIYNPPSAETPAGKVFRAGGAYLGGVLGTLVPFPGSTIAGAITGERVARALTPDFGPRLYEPNVQDMGTREGMASQIGAAVETAAPAIADLALMVASPNAMVGKIISEANQRVQDRQAQGQGSLESYGRTALEEAPMAAATLAGPLAKGFAYAGYPVLAGLSRVLPPAFMAAMAGKNVYEVDAAIKEQFPAMPDDERHSLVAQTASGDIANMAYFTGELGGLGPEIRSYRDIARDPLTGTGGNNVGIYKTPELPPFPLPPFPKTPLPAFPLPKFPREPLPAFPRPPLPEFPIPESLKAAVEEVTKPSITDQIIQEESNAPIQRQEQTLNEEELRGTPLGEAVQENVPEVRQETGERPSGSDRVVEGGQVPEVNPLEGLVGKRFVRDDGKVEDIVGEDNGAYTFRDQTGREHTSAAPIPPERVVEATPVPEPEAVVEAKLIEQSGKPAEPPVVEEPLPVEPPLVEPTSIPEAPVPITPEPAVVLGGEVVLTSSGRETSPFPKVSNKTNRKAVNTVRKVDSWLMDNAIEEAKSRGDEFNQRQFEQNRDKPSQADKDSAEEYLFGDTQPEVPAPFLKPLVESPVPKEAPGTQRMEMTYTDPGGNEVTVSEEPVMVDNLTQKEIDVLRSNMKAASRTGSTDAYTINDILIGKRPVYRWSGNRGGGEVNSYLKLDSEPDAFYRFSKNQNLTVKTINPAAQAEIDRLSADEAALKDAEQKTAEAEKRANEILRARQEQFQDAVKNTPLPTGKKVTVSVPGELNGKPVQIPLSGTQYGDFLITSEPVKNGSTKKNHSVTHVPTGASLVRNLSSIETAKNIVKSWLLSGADTKFTDLKSPEANEAIKRARGAIAATVDVSKEPPAWFGTEEAPPEPSDTDLVNSLSKKQLAQLALKIKSPQMKGKSKTAENLLANVSPDAISEALQKLNLKVGKKGGIYNPIEFIIELGRKAPEAKRWIENKLGDAWDHALDYAQRGKNYTEWAWTALKKYGDPIKEHLRLLWGDAIDFVTRIKAHLSDRNTAGIFPVAPKPVGPNDLEWTRLTPTQKFWMGLQDGMLSVKKIQNSTLDRGGKLSEFMNSYDKELLRPAYTEAALKEKQDVRIRPFLGAIVEGKLTLEQVEQFTKARGTEEANDYLFDKYGVKDGTGMSTPVAKAIMNFYKKAGILPQLEKVGVLYDRMMLSDLETRLHAGLITPELFVELKTRLKHYFPTKGTPYDIELQMDPSIERSATGQGVDLTKTEYQGRKGRSSDVTNVIGHSIEALENGVVRAGKNPVLQAFYEFCKENPLPDVYEIDPVKVESWQTVIHPKFNGIERTVLIKDPMLAESFKRLSPARQGTVMAAFARFNRWQSQVNTSANPFFIAGNAPKDLLGAGITTAIRLGPKALGRYVLNLPGSFKDQVNWIFRGIDSPDRQRFVSSGAPTGFFSNMDAESNALRMNDEFRSMAATPTTDPTFWAKNCGSALLKFTQNLNQVAELGVRAATFKTGIESGLTDTKAAIFSKEASDNFNAKGLWGPTLAALYVFSNASIQGNASMLATIAMNPVGATAVIGGLLAFGATLDTWNASVSEKDPDHPNYYDLESENAKNLNQFILLPGFKPIQIPLPHNWGFFVSAGRITSAISRGALPPGKGMASLGSIFINTMNPTGGFDTAHPVKMAFPSAVRPTIDVLTNTGWHGGPIHGEAFKKTTPQSELYPRTTNEWLVKLTRSLNEIGGGSRYESSGAPDISPADLQYLFSQTFGGLGQEVMRSATLLRKIVTGEEILEREIPGVRRFYPGWNPTVQGSKFFENASVIESYKDARMNDAAKPEDEWKAALIDQADGIIKMMSARKKELNAAKDAGDTGAVKTIYAEIEVAQQNFNSRFKELSK